jgi:hypothetical protein
MMNVVFWDVAQCGSHKNRRSRGTFLLHYQVDKNRQARKNEAIRSSETSILTRAKRRRIPEDGIFTCIFIYWNASSFCCVCVCVCVCGASVCLASYNCYRGCCHSKPYSTGPIFHDFWLKIRLTKSFKLRKQYRQWPHLWQENARKQNTWLYSIIQILTVICDVAYSLR